MCVIYVENVYFFISWIKISAIIYIVGHSLYETHKKGNIQVVDDADAGNLSNNEMELSIICVASTHKQGNEIFVVMH